MSGNAIAKCAKCGISSREDSSLTFHRFPLPSKRDGSLKAKTWAKFCFPNDDWTSDKSLQNLYKQHKLLCGKHFDDSSYTNSDRKRLNKFAIPIDAQSILHQLRQEQYYTPEEAQASYDDGSEIPVEIEVTVTRSYANTTPMYPRSQNDESAVKVDNVMEITASTSHEDKDIENPKTCQKKGLLKELDVKTYLELTPKKQKLYKRCRKNLSEIMRLRQKLRKVKRCKRAVLNTLASNDSVNEIMKSKLSSSLYLLLQNQLKNTSRKLTGRRWSLDDKVLALGIYKKSNSCYRLLRKLFCLPSVSSLKALLNKIYHYYVVSIVKLLTLSNISQKQETYMAIYVWWHLMRCP